MKKENPRNWRMHVTRTLEQLFYRREERNRNHTYVHKHFGQYLTFVELPTFLKDRRQSSGMNDRCLPDHVLVGFLAMKHYFESRSLKALDDRLEGELRDLHRKLGSAPERAR